MSESTINEQQQLALNAFRDAVSEELDKPAVNRSIWKPEIGEVRSGIFQGIEKKDGRDGKPWFIAHFIDEDGSWSWSLTKFAREHLLDQNPEKGSFVVVKRHPNGKTAGGHSYFRYRIVVRN